MTAEKYPPIFPGTPVKTTEPNMSKRNEWTDEGWEGRQWGIQGVVITHHDSHGLCYDVRHEDGSVGCYNPSELEVLNSFIIVEITNLEDTRYRVNMGCTYTEEKLRAWAHETFGVDIDASLEIISSAIKPGGWLMFQYVPQDQEEG